MKHYIEQTQKIERDINILKKWKKEAEENAKVERTDSKSLLRWKIGGFLRSYRIGRGHAKENQYGS